MIHLKGRTVLKDGTVIFDEKGIVELLFSGKDIDKCKLQRNISTELLQKNLKMRNGIEVDLLHEPNTKPSVQQTDKNKIIWLMPEEYSKLDLGEYFLSKTSNETESNRVCLELQEFQNRGMEMHLKLMIFIIETFRKNDVVWGVGRGSACASYLLYLIGVHKVNPLKYNIDYKEFLR